MNADRAAFKAGVPPSQIARQFGLSRSQVRKALSILKRLVARQTSPSFKSP
jgi:hypothetical protein